MKWNHSKKSHRFIQQVSRWLILKIIFLFYLSTARAQIPEGVPHPDDNTPIDFSSWSDIIIYIILPAVLITGYIFLAYYKRRKRQQGEGKNDQNGIQ
jgi:hypothetical protein